MTADLRIQHALARLRAVEAATEYLARKETHRRSRWWVRLLRAVGVDVRLPGEPYYGAVFAARPMRRLI